MIKVTQLRVDADDYTRDDDLEYASGSIDVILNGKAYTFAWVDGGCMTSQSVEVLAMMDMDEEIRFQIEEAISHGLMNEEYELVEEH